MDFFKTAADSVTKAVNFVVDQSRRSAMMNRLKVVIRSEKETRSRAYVQLGKYYYENLRDEENAETEKYCAAVEDADRRLKRAYAKLDELTVPTENGADVPEEDDGPDFESGADPDGEDVSAGENENTDADGEAADLEELNRLDSSADEEAADDDEAFLRPFTVVRNDTQDEEPPADPPESETPQTK